MDTDEIIPADEDGDVEGDLPPQVVGVASDGDLRRQCQGFRYFFSTLCSAGFVVVYALRVCLSVTIVIMAIEYGWDAAQQGVVLSSFFYGYLILQIPGGNWAEKSGGKLVYGLGVFFACVFTLVTPVAARCDFYALIAVRALTGLAEGVTFPAMHTLLSHWAVPSERTKLGGIIYSGSALGTVLALPISATISDTLGYESVFYIFGGVGLVWCLLWAAFASDSPARNWWMSAREKNYIQESIGPHVRQTRPPVPYRRIFTCLPFWAIFVAHTANNYGFYTLLTELPTYMREILRFPLQEDGLLSALPYLLSFSCSMLSSFLGDFLRSRNLVSTTRIRKAFSTIALLVPAIALVTVGYVDYSRPATIALLCLAVGLNGFQATAFGINHIDIAPNFAGTLMGFTNTSANAMGIIAPYILGLIINEKDDIAHWRIAFDIAAVVYLVGNVVFVIFGSGEEQDFNLIDDIDDGPEAVDGSDGQEEVTLLAD